MAFKKRTQIRGRSFRNTEHTVTINSQTITVRDYDSDGKILFAYGTAAASTQDSQSDYAKGAIYIKTDVTTGTAARYQNVGTAASSSFELMTVASTGDISGVTAGAGLTGGGGSGDVTVEVALDIYNDTGGTLTAGTLVKVDAFDSTNGITVVKADADGAIAATHVVKDDISDTTTGTVYPVLTSDADQNTGGQTIGDKVYLDSSTAGGFTFSAPTGADQIVQVVGVVKVVDASVGVIEWFPGARVIEAFGTSHLQDQSVGVNKLHNDARMNTVVVDIVPLPAPTGSDQLNEDRFVFEAPSNSEVVSASIISDTATSSSDETSEYTFELYNSTAANSLATAVTKTSTAEITANTPYDLTVDQNTQISNGDVIVLRTDIEDDGTPNPTDLSSAVVKVQVNYRVRA